MSLSHDVTKARFKYSGRFDYKKFYEFFFEVLAANGYIVVDDREVEEDIK